MEKNPADTTDSSSQSPSQEPAATDRVAPFWCQYVEEAEKYDDAFLEKNKIRVDGVLIFAGLFSTVTASFLISFQGTLQPNPSDTTNALLMMVVHSLDNSTFSGQSIGVPAWNGPTYSSVVAQALGYAALSMSLLAALGAVIGKQWLSDYAASKIGSLQERGSKRQQRLDALEKWRYEAFMKMLPSFIQLALLLFGVALSIAVWEINKTVGYIVISMTGFGVSSYLFVTVASLLHPTCPFRTPLSSMIQETTAMVAKSVEEIADYCAWRSATIPQRQQEPVTNQVNKTLAHLAILLSLLITVCIIPIVIPVLSCCVFVLAISVRNGQDFRTQMNCYRLRYLRTLKESFYGSAIVVRNYARGARDFIRWTRQDPVPDLDHVTPRAVAWLLRTSTHPEKLIAALELAPVVAWPEDSNLSLLGEGPHNLFARSILEIHSLKDRALPLGKALAVLLCRMPLSVRSCGYIREETMEQLDKVIREQIADWDFDVVFTLTIVQKLLRLKLGLGVHESEPFPAKDVSQSLLVWILGLLETMFRLDRSHAKRLFFPEASQLYLKLDMKRANLGPEQQVQYCRTFEIFFNIALGFNVQEMNVSEDLPAIDKEVDCLERILEKLKTINPPRLSDAQEHLIVTLTVLSKLASTPRLRGRIRNASINPWILAAFREAVGNASESKGSKWHFVGCLVQLASDVDAFNLTRSTGSVGLFARLFGHEKPPRMDSKSLLSYLLNKQTPATSGRVIYALRIMLSNEDEHLVLASDPHFVDYILVATESSGEDGDDSIRIIGLKVLTATCQSLLREHGTDSIVKLSTKCKLDRFLHRAILHQDLPTMLKNLLQINNKDFNEKLLGILAPVLDDHFDTLLTKFRDESNKIPDHDLRDLEIALVLSNNEGKKIKLFNHLDHYIATMPLSSQCTIALPLTAIVGWLLRRGGPICSSEKSDWKAFLRPNFKLLLFPAWSDPGALADNPQTLRLLLNCTEKWLSTYGYFGTGASPQSPPGAILARVQRAVDQLNSGDCKLPLDIKWTLRKFSIEINQQGKNLEGSGSGAVGGRIGVIQTGSL